ncbi:hypothetical protein [Mycobacterium scrofulaceum]|nr:hypothetical protein [Mycobacterium scrofulaceum]
MSRLKYKVVLGLVLAATALTSSGCTIPTFSCTGGITGVTCTP